MHHIYKDYYPGNMVVPVLKDVNLNVKMRVFMIMWTWFLKIDTDEYHWLSGQAYEGRFQAGWPGYPESE